MPPRKEENGDWTLKRPCVDYWALDSKTLYWALATCCQLLKITLMYFWAQTDFTTLDLRMGYHQIRIADEELETAFRCLDGLHEWTIVQFALQNAPPVARSEA
jgi:hypothetical protein